MPKAYAVGIVIAVVAVVAAAFWLAAWLGAGTPPPSGLKP
jgi:hypothetical protein